MHLPKTAVIILLASGSVMLANSPLGHRDTPLLKDSGYHVHGSERPHPKKISNTTTNTTPAPSDAVVLFDGTHTDAWKGHWKIVDGALVASPKKDLITKEKFGRIQLHLEFRVDPEQEVQSQQGANSGVFLMGLYEIQVQESHTNVTYADGQAAAMYGQYPPLVNAASPQGEWQSYDIIFEPAIYDEKGLKEPAKTTVFHNGILVHYNQPFLGVSTYRKLPKYPKKALPEKGPLRLQWHNDPVEYRNIWLRELETYPKRALSEKTSLQSQK